MPLRGFVAAGRAMRARLKKCQNRSGPLVGNTSYMHQNDGDFYIKVSVGTPPQDLLFLVDTGSELIWSQCFPCTTCTHTHPRLFLPKLSSSFRSVSCHSPSCTSTLGFTVHSPCITSTCNFAVSYGDGSTSSGALSVDSFHLTPHYAKSMVFGCANEDNETVPTPAGTSGLMGLSPGRFSFTSQLFDKDPHLQKKFAHCLPDRLTNLSAPGVIRFGNYKLATNLSYTPFLMSNSIMEEEPYFYVKLEAITVGRSLIKVATKEVEGGGTIFDSGSALTSLEESVYNELVEEMKRQTTHLQPFAWKSSSDESDLCYKVPLKQRELPKVPLVTLHFAGMVDLELKAHSVLYSAYSNHKSIYLCLALEKADDALNIIGNYQQQNYWVEYNLQTSHLGLAKARCA